MGANEFSSDISAHWSGSFMPWREFQMNIFKVNILAWNPFTTIQSHCYFRCWSSSYVFEVYITQLHFWWFLHFSPMEFQDHSHWVLNSAFSELKLCVHYSHTVWKCLKFVCALLTYKLEMSNVQHYITHVRSCLTSMQLVHHVCTKYASIRQKNLSN